MMVRSSRRWSPDGPVVVFLPAFLTVVVGDESWQGHFVEADVESYGPCHEQVVVLSIYGAVTAVLPPHVGEVFVEASLVAFDV